MHRTRLFAATLCLALSACATTSQVERRACQAGDAYTQGYKDAANGLPSAQLAQDQTRCAAQGIAIDANAYAQGRQAAMRDICPHANGLPEGAGCPNSMPLIDPISADSKIIDQRYAMDKANAEVRRLQTALDAAEGERRAELAPLLRDAQLHAWWAKETLDRMEWLIRRPGIAF
ncbi:DUF2799 domain-containing protein [Niveibacterium sp. SC-1]|uniref:DUF2799 domain-containing protein n=1 Tax=Niveibacterium sp. SC-1 TaxID=3135646 RepID=UPI00311E0541